MSRGFVKEGDQEEVPMVLPRAFLPQGVPNYVTPEGLHLLNEEMEGLKNERAEAASNYILKNHIEAKMRQLTERINTAVLIDPKKAHPDVVSFGMYVRYNDKTIRIVGVDEADASKGLISFLSPIAKSLIGKRKGDKFEIKVPKGTEIVEVKEVNSQPTLTTNQHEITRMIGVKSVQISGQTSTTNQRKSTQIVSVTSESMCESSKDKGQKINDKISQVTQNDSTDFLPIINDRGNIVGRALHCEIHNGNKVLHPAVHLIVSNSKNETVGKYCWHVEFGETAEKTLKRKIVDVTSQNVKPKLKRQYIREDKNEKELVSVFTAVCDGEILPSPDDKEYEAMFAKD